LGSGKQQYGKESLKMTTSGISTNLYSYTISQSSVSQSSVSTTKKSGITQGNDKLMELNLSFSQFKASAKSESFETFTGQGVTIEDVMSLGRQTGASDSSDSISGSQSFYDSDNYWGVEKTSERISDFVLKAAGDDLELLKAGREGILKGFEEAEQAWGGELPDISYDTLTKSLDAIDEKIRELGGSVVDIST
jgi:hypothetical protein